MTDEKTPKETARQDTAFGASTGCTPAPLVQVFSSGGGTQSTAIAALIVQGKLAKPDFVVIADTERERGTTWTYLDEITRPALMSAGVEVHRISLYEWGLDTGLWNGRDAEGNTLHLPCFSSKSGDGGKLSGFCSSQWKVRTIDRWLSKVQGLTRSKYRKWIGFSLNEWRRAQRIMAGKEGQAGLIWLPLIQELHLNRHEAIQAVLGLGWPMPPRSRCWMCPNQSDAEWREVRNNAPEEFFQAVDVEREIHQKDPHAWLHKSCRPLNTVDFGKDDFDSGLYCDSGVCFV